MKKSIFRSICLAAGVVFLASLLLIMGVLYDYFSKGQQSRLKTLTAFAAQAVEQEGLSYFEGFSPEDTRVTWIAPDGSVLYDSGSKAGQMENHLNREEVKEALASGYGESTRYSTTLLERQLYAAQKLSDGSIVRLSDTHLTAVSLTFAMIQPILLVGIVAVVLASVLASGLSKKIVKPLQELTLDETEGNRGYEELQPLFDRVDSRQRQLGQQAAKLRQEFTANVSHELKTPLHAISGYAELMKNGIVKQEDLVNFSERIYSEAQRMIVLVDDIIKLSRLDEGREETNWEETDLYTLAEETIRTLQPSADTAKVTVTLDGGPARMRGIPQMLTGIIYNLCDNAIKYNRENGSVSVEVKDRGEYISLSVSDTGIGIPKEHTERVFERFYRVDKSHSKEVGGTGLGLSIVKHSVKIHNARITLQSVVDGGTTVSVRFPK